MPDHDELADQETARVTRFMIIRSRGSVPSFAILADEPNELGAPITTACPWCSATWNGGLTWVPRSMRWARRARVRDSTVAAPASHPLESGRRSCPLGGRHRVGGRRSPRREISARPSWPTLSDSLIRSTRTRFSIHTHGDVRRVVRRRTLAGTAPPSAGIGGGNPAPLEADRNSTRICAR